MGESNSVHLMRGREEASDGGGAEATKAAGSDAVTINIRRSNATKFVVQVSLESSVESFKSIIANNCEIPAEQQHLVYKGWHLKDDRTLKTYGMEAEHTVHLVGGFQPAESADITGVDGSSSSRADILGGFQELSLSGASSYSRVGMSGILQRLFQNPNLLPETIYQLTNDPESMRTKIVRNPQLREVIDRLPDLARIVHSPVIFHDLAQAVVYFELIREMRRYRESGGD